MKRRIAVPACWIPAVIAALLLSAAPVRAEAYVEAYRSPFGVARAVAADPTDGSCWAAMGSRVYHLAPDGAVLAQFEGCERVDSLAVDPTDGSCWLADWGGLQLVHLSREGVLLGQVEGVASPGTVALNPADGSLWTGGWDGALMHLSADGETLWSGSGFGYVRGLSVNSQDGSCWVADGGQWDDAAGAYVAMAVLHLAADGTELWRSGGFTGPWSVSVNPSDGSCWVSNPGQGIADQYVVHLAADGTELWRSTDIGGSLAVSVNPADGSCWVASYWWGQLVHLAADGTRLWTGDGFTSLASLSVNPADGSCWAASDELGEAIRVAASGEELARAGLFGLAVQGVSVNRTDHSVWVADEFGERVGHLAQDGSVLWLGEGFCGVPGTAVNPADGSCWVADDLVRYGGTEVHHLASDGSELWHGPLFPDTEDVPTAIGVDPNDGSCWVSGRTDVAHLSEDGTEVWRAGGFGGITALAVNPTDGSCWVADGGAYDYGTGEYVGAQVVHYAADGSELWRGTAFAHPRSLSVNPADGSCWVADLDQAALVHVAADGSELLRQEVRWPYAVAVDARDGSCWVSTYWELLHVAPDGTVAAAVRLEGCLSGNGLAVDADGSMWAALDSFGQVVHVVPGLLLSLSGERGSVRVDGVEHPLPWSGAFQEGAQVTLYAEPAAQFLNWSGDLTGSQNPATVVMDSDLSIGVRFTEHGFDLSCAADPAVVFPGGTTHLTAAATDSFGHGVAEYVWEAFEDLRAAQVGSLEGGRPVELAVQGSYAYGAAEGAFTVYDLSDPGSPQLVAALDVPGGAETVAVSGRYAYVGVLGGNGRGFQVVDIGDPAAPVAVGSYWSECGCRRPAIAAAGSYVYFSAADPERYRFLGVFDVTDPSHPLLVGAGPLDPCACDLTVSGSYVYSSSGAGPFQTVDVSHPTAPVAAGSLDLGIYGVAVAAADTYAYVAGNSLAVLDVSDPAQPALVGSLSLPSNAADLSVDGAYAYLAGDDGLRVVDVSAPGAPAVVGECASPLGQTGVAVSTGYAYVAAPSGLAAFRVADPSAPALAGSEGAYGGAGLIAAFGRYAYVPSRDGLQVLDLAAAGGPAEVSVASPGTGFAAVAIAGGYAYASAAGAPEQGLVIFDLSDPSHPVRTGAWTEPVPGDGIFGSPGAVVVSGNYAFVTETCDGVAVYDVTDRAHPVRVTRLPLASQPGCQTSLALVGDVLYVSTRTYPAMVSLVDVSVPTDPVLTGSITDLWGCCGTPMAAAGDRLYLGTMDGLLVYDASDPRAPVAIGSYQSEQPVREVAVSGSHALLTTGYSGGDASLRLLDVSDPAAPALLAGYPGHGGGWHRPSAALSPGYICFADAGWGVTAFDRSLITGAGTGSFSPSPYVLNPTYTAPASTGGRDETIALRLRATCSGDPALNASASCIVTVNGAVTLTASANPAEGGSVTGGGSHPYGATATVTAAPAVGWAFDHWSGPVADPEAATTAVLMDEDKSVTANFVRTWFEDDDLSISYRGTWRTLSDPLATAGHLRYSKAPRASATFSFTGTGLKWHTMLGPQMGKAQVWLDGAGPLLVDLYRSTSQAATISQLDLSPGQHTIVVQVSGKRNRASKGTRVSVDAFEVLP